MEDCCFEIAHNQYQLHLQSQAEQQKDVCKALLPGFLSAVRQTVTSDALAKNNGAVYLPIRKGCFPVFAGALDKQVRVVVPSSSDPLTCECVLFMSMKDGMVLTPSIFSGDMCGQGEKREK